MTIVYHRKPSIEASPLHGESLLFDPATNKFCLLNSTAAFVWDRLAEPVSVETLAADVCREFNAPELALVADDVRQTLRRFEELALVTIAS